MAATNIISKVKECKAFLSEEDKSYSLQFRLLHRFQCYRKVPGEDTRISTVGSTFSIPYKVFLAIADELLPEEVRLMNLTAPELADVLQSASVDIDFEDHKAGEEYTTADGKTDKYNHDGTNKTFNKIVLNPLTINEVRAKRQAEKNREAKKNEVKDAFDVKLSALMAAGVNIENMHLTL